MLMYRAGSICIDKEVIIEANRIIFDFIWKGKDKVKRISLISDTKDGGLKAPHLESIIKTQRIMFCKKLVENEPCHWKTILLHYLKPVGNKFILCCNFDVKKLPINLPKFYRECFECFAQCSASTCNSVPELSHEEILNTVIWNNKFICINGKSVFNQSLISKGLFRIGDLVSVNIALNHNKSTKHFNTVKTSILYIIQERSSYSIFGSNVLTLMYHVQQVTKINWWPFHPMHIKYPHSFLCALRFFFVTKLLVILLACCYDRGIYNELCIVWGGVGVSFIKQF